MGSMGMRGILATVVLFFFVTGIDAADNKIEEKTLSWETPNDDYLRILQLKLDRYLLEDIVTAYQYKEGIYIPLGLFSQSVGLAIEVKPEEGIAEGFVLNESRRFYLDYSRKELTISGVTSKLDSKDIKLYQDDIYLHESVLEKYLPLKLNIDLFSLMLVIEPSEPFPLQTKIQREERVGKIRAQTGSRDRGYEKRVSPYKNWDYPFIDTSMGLTYRKTQDGSSFSDINYTTYLTADLGQLETAAYISGNSTDFINASRISFSRHDPDAKLLAGLQAREYSFGYVNIPSIAYISQHQSYLPGVQLSNYELNQQSNFESHTFQGPLLPGWEVELYQNEILVGYVSEPINGEYIFNDVPLLFGNNYFRLAFYGKHGEYREETYTYILNNSLTREGEFHYRIGTVAEVGASSPRIQLQSDYGLNKNLTLYANMVSLNLGGVDHNYMNVGVAGFLNYLYARAGVTQDSAGGNLVDLSMQTRFSATNISLNYALMDEFKSEVLTEGDPIVNSSGIKVDTAIPKTFMPRLPVALSYKQDSFFSGGYKTEFSNRISMYTKELALVNEITEVDSTVGGTNGTSGTLSLSAHRFSYSLRGDINYEISPLSDISSLSINYTAKNLGPYSYDFGLSRFNDNVMQYVVGIHKRSNIYTYDVGVGYKTDGEISLNSSMSINFAKDQKKNDWKISSNPMAGKGAASIDIYMDENYNGIRDPDEKGLKDIDIEINGVRRFVKSDEDGHIFLTDIPIYENMDIGVSMDSLLDPLYVPKIEGYQTVYRPGHVIEYSFPIILTGEIDGTTYIRKNGKTRHVGDVELELVDANNKLIKTIKSAYDGFYVISKIPAGNYTLRISTEQKKRLNLVAKDQKVILNQAEMFISGSDFIIDVK
ncbi:MAG: hypothetical protein OEX12_03765 [Gammaproteobacteria bacterium]|nr:hypothetical protein [Gammaproteobacteria bacterium]